MNHYRYHMTIFVLIAICCFTCNNDSSSTTQIVDDRVAEQWISKLKTEWPQIVLTNYADFNGHSSLLGASSFLIKTDDDRVLAATAAHLIGSAGGVVPDIPINQLTQKIRSWKMFPRTMPDDYVEVTSLGADGLEGNDLDWLILSIKNSDRLPASPLKLRRVPVRVGETVFLIGCPYIEQDCKQNVYTGVITERAFGNCFRFNIDPSVDLRGFSGSPIIDEKGYVVGIVSIWFDPKMSGDKYLEAGGEDIEFIYDLLQSTN